MIKWVFAVAMVVGFGSTVSAGQSAPPSEHQTSDETKANLDNYEKFYRETFRKDAIDKCVASAPKAAAAGFDVSPTCACASDAYLTSKTLDQLIKLEKDEATSKELAAITAGCLKTSPPLRKPKST